MTNKIWVLGATGRSGRVIAERLHEMGLDLVLAGRDPARLAELAAKLGAAETVSGSLDELLSRLHDAPPAVVVNTVGPFARTTGQSSPRVRRAPTMSTSPTNCPQSNTPSANTMPQSPRAALSSPAGDSG